MTYDEAALRSELQDARETLAHLRRQVATSDAAVRMMRAVVDQQANEIAQLRRELSAVLSAGGSDCCCASCSAARAA